MGVTQVESTNSPVMSRARPSAAACVLVGVVSGLAWAAAFRAYMSEIAGGASRIDWYGTFPLTMPDALLALVTQGLGGGAVAIALIADGAAR